MGFYGASKAANMLPLLDPLKPRSRAMSKKTVTSSGGVGVAAVNSSGNS